MHETFEVEWPEVVSSSEYLGPGTRDFEDSLNMIVQTSAEAFSRIDIEDMVAYALHENPRGFQAFNNAHLSLANDAAKQRSADRNAFWTALCVRASKHSKLLYHAVRRALFTPDTLADWDLGRYENNPVYVETLAPIRAMWDFYQPGEFLERLPLLTRKVKRTGQVASQFHAYDIVRKLSNRHLWETIQRKWEVWIEFHLNQAVGDRWEHAPTVWAELAQDFADIYTTESRLQSVIEKFGQARESSLDLFSSTAITAGLRSLKRPSGASNMALEAQEISRVKKLMEENPQYLTPLIHEETESLYQKIFKGVSR